MVLAKFNGMDIAVLVETARVRSLVVAAKALNVDHTTAFRRLKNFEKRLGYALFERSENSYTLTLEGHRLFELAESIESNVYAFEREAFARDVSETGTIRVTTPDSIGINYLPRLIGEFRQLHPAIHIEVSIANEFMNLSKREADIAIRPTKKLEGNVVARKAATMAFAPYATRQYLDKFGDPANSDDLDQHTICGFDGGRTGVSSANWMNSLPTPPQYRFDNTTALLNAVRAGIGIGVCPCFIGDAQDDLRRLKYIEPNLTTGIWIATHPEIRHVGRVRTFIDFAFDTIRRDRKLFSGAANTIADVG